MTASYSFFNAANRSARDPPPASATGFATGVASACLAAGTIGIAGTAAVLPTGPEDASGFAARAVGDALADSAGGGESFGADSVRQAGARHRSRGTRREGRIMVEALWSCWRAVSRRPTEST